LPGFSSEALLWLGVHKTVGRVVALLMIEYEVNTISMLTALVLTRDDKIGTNVPGRRSSMNIIVGVFLS